MNIYLYPQAELLSTWAKDRALSTLTLRCRSNACAAAARSVTAWWKTP